LGLYNQQQQQATDREMALRARKADFDAQRVRAEGEGSLPALLQRGLQGGMTGAKFQQDWRQGEQDIRGKQANQALAEESLAGAKLDRGLKEQYGAREAEGRLRGMDLGNQATEGQIKMQGVQTEGAQLDLQMKQAEQQ
jgi:hypothetical protein